jgi:hypothetical protein
MINFQFNFFMCLNGFFSFKFLFSTALKGNYTMAPHS